MSTGGDQELIRDYLSGDATAVGRIDTWIERASYPYRRRLGDAWEDLLQDVRLEATRLLGEGRFRGDSSLKTYLWRVTNNACIDRVRARHRVVWEEVETADARGELPFDSAGNRALRGETRDLLGKVLAKMSDDCKRLWQMILLGMSYREMSEQTGISEGALRVRVLRCRQRAVAVREELEEGAAGSPA